MASSAEQWYSCSVMIARGAPRPRTLRRQGRVFAALVLLVAAASCASTSLEDLLAGKACGADGACAPGYACDVATWRCVVPGGGGSGAGGTGDCDVVADCPPPASGCEVPICLANACGTLPAQTGPAPAAEQVAGDCTLLVCDGLGHAVGQNDDADAPGAPGACVATSCVAGVAVSGPVRADEPCAEAGGEVCDGAGQCVACNAASHCTHLMPSECATPGCSAHTCGLAPSPQGTALALQTAGDCQRTVCDGAGGVATIDDDSDVPFDDNPCTSDVCGGGVQSNPPEPVATPCGGVLVCDGAGHCAGCGAPGDCPGSDGECRTRTCVAGVCGFAFVPDDTPLSAGAQIAGDCQQARCNGAGGVKFVPIGSDLPPDDGNPCTGEACAGGAPLHPPAAAGTACSAPDAAVCDGSGQCVACNVASDCWNQGAVCQVPNCAAHVCGVADAPAGTPAPASAQTSGDCRILTCNGAGGTTPQADAGDLPVDGNDCTADVCSGTVPSNPPRAAGTACAGGGSCNGAGLCSAKKPNGSICAAPGQCTSGACVDGVCCATACGASCRACSAAKSGAANGTCAFVPKGEDPDAECAGADTCDGAGTCAFVCGSTPAAPGGACPAACTGGCLAGTCIIACNSVSCANQALTCPPGFACTVQCGASSACDGATITCPDKYACDVVCSGSCRAAVIDCGSGSCDLACGGGAKCKDAVMNCGDNSCHATCQAGQKPAVSCNGTCDCAPC